MSSPPQNPPFDLTIARAIGAVIPGRSESTECETIGLFDEYRDRLLRYVVSIGLSVHDGEDVVQEVFLSLFRHLKMGRSRDNLRGWVFRVAHNLALKKRNGNQKRLASIGVEQSIALAGADSGTNPETQFENNERRRRLLAVMQALAEQDRWCLYLRAEGLRYREIAAVVGISLGSVSNSLAKSMERLMRENER